MSNEAADLLRKARARIEDPKQWVQRALVIESDDGNLCHCADGALLWVSTVEERLRSGASLHLSLAARSLGFETASKFNDAPGRTHAEVLGLFDLAIGLAEAAAEVPS